MTNPKLLLRSLLVAALLLTSAPQLLLSADPPAQYDYSKMFDYSLKLLTRAPVRKFLKDVFAAELEISPEMQKKYGFPETISEMSESQFLLLLQKNPKLWPMLDEYIKAVPEIKEDSVRQEAIRKKFQESFREVIADKEIDTKFREFNDPTKPFPLIVPNGKPGYKNLELFVNHPSVRDGKTLPASDLKAKMIAFIEGADKELDMNFFDFDLVEIAEAAIKRAKDGVQVRVGIDSGTVEERPGVKAVFDMLGKEKNILVHAVDSVGLSHQKMMARDWSVEGKGAVLMSSGNATQSCIGPEGDAVGVKERPWYSVPNANHLVTMESNVVALLVNHELSKTLDPEYQLRGREYPLGGAYQVFGGSGNNTPKDPYIIIAFSPRGALGNINSDIIGQLILKSRGPIHMAQFAFSAKTVEEALKERARIEIKETGKFDFKIVGDTPFAMRDWSILLSMAGYKVVTTGEGDTAKSTYVDDPKSEWKEILGKERFEKFRAAVLVAPKQYGTHSFTLPDGSSMEITSKIHHKVIVSGISAIIGTSFNFSENALINHEQLLLVHDPAIAEQAAGMVEGLAAQTKRSVADVALKRNEFAARDAQGGEVETDTELEPKNRKRLLDLEDGVLGRKKRRNAKERDAALRLEACENAVAKTAVPKTPGTK